MSFQSDAQQLSVCRALLSRVGRGRLFDETGPTPEAVRLLKSKSGSSSEVLMLQVAFDVWNGRGGAPFHMILGVFDRTNMGMIAALMIALNGGPQSIDAWLSRFEPKAKVSL